jgi:hypothetical protein
MAARIDHIVVVAHSLDAGAEFVQQSLGYSPGPGRKHHHMGTHNLLLSLGASIYLEVVAIDPEAAPISRPRWFGLDSLAAQPKARLAAWVADTDDIHLDASPELGDVEKMEREGLTWQMSMTPDGSAPLSGAAPLLIQRATNFHPASRLPDVGLRLRRLKLGHPQPEGVARLLARLELPDTPSITLQQAAPPTLCAEIETPLGVRSLGEA